MPEDADDSAVSLSSWLRGDERQSDTVSCDPGSVRAALDRLADSTAAASGLPDSEEKRLLLARMAAKAAQYHDFLAATRHLPEHAIGADHPKFLLTQCIQRALRAVLARDWGGELTAAEFGRKVKEWFFPNDDTDDVHDPLAFKFNSLAPCVFRDVRRRFGVDELEFALELTAHALLPFGANSKSGEFFFFTYRQALLVKTISSKEAATFLEMLPSYHAHLAQCPHTLMTRLFGLHSIRMGHTKHYFIIMGSVFAAPRVMHKVFDLKGCAVGRSASPEERAKRDAVLKDNDFREQGIKLHLGPHRERFLEQLTKDVGLLRAFNIMDYSLLVGIHYPQGPPADCPQQAGANPWTSDEGGFPAVHEGKPECYYFALIDTFIVYDLKKMTAHQVKALSGKPAKQLSTINSNTYAARFLQFMSDAVD